MGKKITIEEMQRELHKYSKGEILAALHRKTLKYSAQLERVAKTMASAGGDALTPRTGRLVASIQARPKKRRHGTTITLQAGGSGLVKYAKVHEQDGHRGSFWTIKPKNAKYLVFPVSADAFTGAGVARGGGAGSGWVSVKQVRIPSRPFLRPAWVLVNKKIKKDMKGFLKQEVMT